MQCPQNSELGDNTEFLPIFFLNDLAMEDIGLTHLTENS